MHRHAGFVVTLLCAMAPMQTAATAFAQEIPQALRSLGPKSWIRVDGQDSHGDQEAMRVTSLVKATTISTASSSRPTSVAISRTRIETGRRLMASMAQNIR